MLVVITGTLRTPVHEDLVQDEGSVGVTCVQKPFRSVLRDHRGL